MKRHNLPGPVLFIDSCRKHDYTHDPVNERNGDFQQFPIRDLLGIAYSVGRYRGPSAPDHFLT
jgi:hypothetical protein